MAGQLPQEIEVGGREGHAVAIEAHVPTRPVDPQAAELQALGGRAEGGRLRRLPLLAELDP